MATELTKMPNITPGTVSVLTPQGYEAALGLAKTLVESGFLPKAIQRPAQALAVILAGQELGLPPMQSLRQIHIVEGKPTLSAELMLSLFKRRGGQAKFLESTDQKAVLWLKHPNGDEHTESFSIQDAQRAGVTNKDNWRKYPKAMLKARVTSAGIRAVGEADGFYMPEELGAEPAPADIVVEAEPSPKAPALTVVTEESSPSASGAVPSESAAPSTEPLERVPGSDDGDETGEVEGELVDCFKLVEEGNRKNHTYKCEWLPTGKRTKRTEQQAAKMVEGLELMGIEPEDHKSSLMSKFGKETIDDLSVDEADEYLDHLRSRWNKRKYKHPRDKAAAKDQRSTEVPEEMREWMQGEVPNEPA